MKKFVIVAPSYDDKIGGVIAQHKLCDMLNKLGYESFLHPYESCYINSPANFFMSSLRSFASQFLSVCRKYIFKYHTKSTYTTPILKKFDPHKNGDFIVVYPEIVNGNPLGATNVVRWFLHQPGFHTGIVCYGTGELYFRFNAGVKKFFIDGSRTSDNYLKVVNYPLEYYNSSGCADKREGIAYCIRKGKKKDVGLDLENAILIDGKDHKEVSGILKKVKTFISFDEYTAYSVFAILCGCESIVIPSDNSKSESEWYPDEKDRYGIAYGFDKLEWAKSTAAYQVSRVENEMRRSEMSAKGFADEAIKFFTKK